ncbi:hypothetical protein, partial [Sinorhizobium medicae]|uniref:hypothetical protein n=1 Tax=Sinorhizobium medicae TaxID=110321 RepID=UPI0027DCA988
SNHPYSSGSASAADLSCSSAPDAALPQASARCISDAISVLGVLTRIVEHADRLAGGCCSGTRSG